MSSLTKLLDSLQEIGVELDKEITGFRDEADNARVQALFGRATRLAREISSARKSSWTLSSSMACVGSAIPNGEAHAVEWGFHQGAKPPTETRPTGTGRTAATGAAAGPLGDIIRRSDFGGDVRHRSRLNDGAIEININNPDFLALSRVPRSHQVAYVAMLLGKEIIAYNDSSRASDEALEKMAAYGNSRAVKGMEIDP